MDERLTTTIVATIASTTAVTASPIAMSGSRADASDIYRA